jgi:glycosyltransferase involved in cell wall biosynthesis
VPVVTSAVSSLPEVGGDAVKYCNPNSFEDMAAKMFELIKSPEEQARFSALGLERAKNFTWEKCAKKHLEVYERLA